MALNRPVDHKEYIRLKYLSEAPEEVKEKKIRKKVKVKAATKISNIRIYDDDLDLKKIQCEYDDDDIELQFGTSEEKPSVANVIDDRSIELKRKDIDRSTWRPVAAPDGQDAQKSRSQSSPSSKNPSHQSKKSSDSVRPEIIKKEPGLSEERDLSPPRASKKLKSNDDDDLSPPRVSSHKDSGRDLSPPRRHKPSDEDSSPPRFKKPSRWNSESKSRREEDSSPPRIRHRRNSGDDHRSSRRDSSPPRDRSRRRDSPSRRDRHSDKSDRRSERSDRDHRSETKRENRSDRDHRSESKREDRYRASSSSSSSHVRNKLGLTDDEMGRNAKTVYRDKGTGQKRDMEAEAITKVKPDPEEEELKRKYERWSKGVKQVESLEERTQEVLKEMDKPLARYEDDEDRDKYLRERELEDDPMLKYIRKKKLKEEIKKVEADGKVYFVKPKYQGPPPPPNRFKIEPGHRWDGVDRSNGFENKLLSKNAEKLANQEEAYKWSTEDM